MYILRPAGSLPSTVRARTAQLAMSSLVLSRMLASASWKEQHSSYRDPWADPTSRSTLGFYNLQHIGVQNWASFKSCCTRSQYARSTLFSFAASPLQPSLVAGNGGHSFAGMHQSACFGRGRITTIDMAYK